MSYNAHTSSLHLVSGERARVTVTVEEGKQVIDMPNMGFTIRSLRGAAAHFIKEGASNDPLFYLRYQGHLIGTVSVVVNGK